MVAAGSATWEHFVDDVRLGWVVGNGISRGQRALQTQLKRAAATLTVVLHLFQFTVYADCAHTCTPVSSLAHFSFSLSPSFSASSLLFAVTILLSFNCLLGAVARFSFALLLLRNLLATRQAGIVCQLRGGRREGEEGEGGVRGRVCCIRGCYSN